MSIDHRDRMLLYTIDNKDTLHQTKDIEDFIVLVMVPIDSLVKTPDDFQE